MDEMKLLAELTKNCEGKKAKLFELMKTYEVAVLGRDVQRQEFKEIENKVLSEHEFLCGRCDIKKRSDDQPSFGDRITDEMWDFLLSDEDFNRLQKTLLPYYVKAGLTDEKGYYVTNWDEIVCDARCELVDYIIDEIVPSDFRGLFAQNKKSIIFQEKLIKVFKNSVKAAA